METASLIDIPNFLGAHPSLFYLSLLVIATSFFGSLYFFIEWLRHGRQQRFALFWSLGLLSAYLFQIPILLANYGLRFFLGDFSLFFAITFFAAFIGNLLIYEGVLFATRSHACKSYPYLVPALSLSVLFSAFYAWGKDSAMTSFVPLINIIVLFLPLFVLTMIKLRRWYGDPSLFKTRLGKWGIGILVAAFCVKILQSLFIVFQFLSFSTAFWFLALADSPVIFFSQILSTLMLLVGFLFMHKDSSPPFREEEVIS